MGDQRPAAVDEATVELPARAAGETVVAEEPSRFRRFRAHPSILALVAFLFYVLVSFVLWGLPVGADLTSRHIGMGGSDLRLYMWSMEWIPHVIDNGLDPFRTDLVYAPGGVDLTWVTTMPGPALVLWPITAAFGPLASVNVAMLLAPALAGWAGFLVCRRVTGAFWPSLVGGYLIGFSSYLVNQMFGHMNLVLIFPAFLAVYLVIRRVESSLGVVPFIGWMTLCVVGLFSISTELLASSSLFGAIALLGGWAFGGGARHRIFRAGLQTGAAYAIAAVLLLPILLPALREVPSKPIRPPTKASVDLLSFVMPRPSVLLGGERYRDVTSSFTANTSEDGAYLGIVLIGMLIGSAVAGRRRRETWLLLGFAAVAALLALGPVLHIGGEPRVALPGAVLTGAPLLEHATPQRFSAYMWVPVGVIAAIWLSGARGAWGWPRWAVVLLGAITLLPIVEAPPHGDRVPVPRFITDGTFREHIEPGEIVYAVVTVKGDEMAWQATADFELRLAQGYIGPIPEEYLGEGISKGLALVHPLPYMPPIPVVMRYADEHRVAAFVSSDAATPHFEDLLLGAGWRPEHVSDVTVWRRASEPDG